MTRSGFVMLNVFYILCFTKLLSSLIGSVRVLEPLCFLNMRFDMSDWLISLVKFGRNQTPQISGRLGWPVELIVIWVTNMCLIDNGNSKSDIGQDRNDLISSPSKWQISIAVYCTLAFFKVPQVCSIQRYEVKHGVFIPYRKNRLRAELE